MRRSATADSGAAQGFARPAVLRGIQADPEQWSLHRSLHAIILHTQQHGARISRN
jgi:hypothetical protein